MGWLDRKANDAATKRALHLMAPGETVVTTEVGASGIAGRSTTCVLLLTERAVYVELRGQPFVRFDLLQLSYVVTSPTRISLWEPSCIPFEVTVRPSGGDFDAMLRHAMMGMLSIELPLRWRDRDLTLHYTPWRLGHPASWTGLPFVSEADRRAILEPVYARVHEHRAGRQDADLRQSLCDYNPDSAQKRRALAAWLGLSDSTVSVGGYVLDELKRPLPSSVFVNAHELVVVQQLEELGFAEAEPSEQRIRFQQVLALDFMEPLPGKDYRVVRVLRASAGTRPGTAFETALHAFGTSLMLLGLPINEAGDRVAELIQTGTVMRSRLYRGPVSIHWFGGHRKGPSSRRSHLVVHQSRCHPAKHHRSGSPG
jgi:hypothetical protein